MHIIIMGAGIAGLTSALALKKHLPDPQPTITIVEVRSAPSTIGGAVNLTPKALRYLSHLEVYDIILSKGYGADCQGIDVFDLYTGSRVAEVSFRGADGKGIGKGESKKFFSRRVMRRHLQESLLEAVNSLEDTTILWGKKVNKIMESRSADGVQLIFEDGDDLACDLLLGCDGIHSATRKLLIEPNRQPTYTGVSIVMATSKVRSESQLRWQTTQLTTSRRGSFMASYFEKTRIQQYIAVVTEVAEVADREGWKIRGSDQQAIKTDIMDRFKCDTIPEIAELVEDAGEWTLYPSYALPPKGRWTSIGQSCVLLGDAAHAMPPQGESTGICIEDAVIFSRCIMHHDKRDIPSVLAAYEKVRREPIDRAYDEAVRRWETVKDSGWFMYKMKTLLTPWILSWVKNAKDEEFAEDWSEVDIEV